ncbi:MAG TPA: Stp1/IreP family PP2C-type Ser/Thr phosphatase [Acidimicrobiales bacterium]|nr:Stp1/IreP family PP2C-type Ser/Thr phosphatase [Acidimicrobiales bacterium]
MTVLRSGSATDVGRVRTVNEDRALEGTTLFAVADGMGGHAGGEVASAIAIEALQTGFTRTPTTDGLVAAVQEANRAVWQAGVQDQALRGMGTTVVAAALVAMGEGDRLVLVNVGDSRAYRFHAGSLVQLSLDHSVAEELVARGELSEAEAAVHPHRHILTRALGVAPAVEVDVWDVVPVEGDRFLLCSDGLTNEVVPDLITSVLATISDPKAAAEKLVSLANESGGNDNITAVVLDVLIGEPPVVEQALPEDLTGSVSAADVAAADVAAADVPAAAGAPGAADGGVIVSTPETPTTSPPGAPLAASGLPRQRRHAPRRITFRVLLFLILLAALAYGAWYVIKTYVDDSYYVGLENRELVVYQGRPGGFLGMEPKIVTRTGVKESQVDPNVLHALRAGVQEPTRSAATRYVSQLVVARCSIVNPPATCATTTTTTTTAVAPGTPTTVTGTAP